MNQTLPPLAAAESRRELFLLLLFSLLFLGLGIGLRTPWPADEPRFALIALEMLQNGDWLFPYRGGELYPDKPPVFVWMQALFYLLTGSMKIAFLLPSLLSAMVVLGLVYDLCRRFYGADKARYGVLLLLCTLQFVLQAKKGQIDMTVCMWITLGNYGLLRHFLLGPQWRWYYAGWFAMGLGVITKGVGFLPMLLCLPWLWLCLRHSRDEMSIRGSLLHLLGIPVLLAAVSLWVVPMVLTVEQLGDAAHLAYRDNILLRQTAERYVSALGHHKPFYYFIVMVIPLFWLPLSAMLPWLAPRWIRSIRDGDRLAFLLLAWSVLVLLFFSFSPGKRGVYVLPILPMLAVIAAPYVPELITLRRIRAAAWKSVLLLGAALALTAMVALMFSPEFTRKVPLEGNEVWYFILLVGVLLMAPAVYWRKSQPVKGMFVGLCLMWVVYSTWGYQLLEPSRSPEAVMDEINRTIGAEDELAIVHFREQLLLHSGRDTFHFGYHTPRENQQRAAARWLSESPSKRWVLLPERYALDCFDPDKGIALGDRHRRSWHLLRYGDLLPEDELAARGCNYRTDETTLYRSPAVQL